MGFNFPWFHATNLIHIYFHLCNSIKIKLTILANKIARYQSVNEFKINKEYIFLLSRRSPKVSSYLRASALHLQQLCVLDLLMHNRSSSDIQLVTSVLWSLVVSRGTVPPGTLFPHSPSKHLSRGCCHPSWPPQCRHRKPISPLSMGMAKLFALGWQDYCSPTYLTSRRRVNIVWYLALKSPLWTEEMIFTQHCALKP